MLLIREEQLAALNAAVFEAFLQRVARSLVADYPDDLAEGNALAFARLTVLRARQHGLESETDLVLYAETALILGQDFETDPRCAWAAAILRDEELGTISERMSELWDRLDDAP